MSDKTYAVQARCPHCGHEEILSIAADERLALPQGEAPKALAQCPECGKPYNAPVTPDTCAEWDDFCREIPPVPQA
ncbi:hypothetical protein [Desulfocurvus sp. DL9XJH121]